MQMRTMLMLLVCGLSIAFAAQAKEADGDAVPGVAWAHADKTQAANWSEAKLAEADAYAHSIQSTSWLVVQHGRIIHEYGDTAKPVGLQSMRKSVASVLVGMYVDRGVIHLDSTLAQLGIDDSGGLTDGEKQATLRQLMQGRSGIYHPGALEAIRYAGPRPARGSYKPGEHFYYNNWDFNAVGQVFSRLTGKSVAQAFADDLATPLQMQDYHADRDSALEREDVSDIPAYTFHLSSRDMARLGLLVSRYGNWNGKQLVSKAWLADSTTSYSEFRPGLGFGYMWYLGTGQSKLTPKLNGHVRIGAMGSNGQEMIVIPDFDLVIVHNVDGDGPTKPEVTEMQVGTLMTMIFGAME